MEASLVVVCDELGDPAKVADFGLERLEEPLDLPLVWGWRTRAMRCAMSRSSSSCSKSVGVQLRLSVPRLVAVNCEP